jgi:hypothetical protein
MISRSDRPIATLTSEMDPGPRAQIPRFMPTSSGIAPDTNTIGACGPVDIAQVRSPMDGSRMQSIVAMMIGMASGRHPAITAFAAILRTVPTPNPGAKRPTTSLPSRPDASIIASTFACVGGTRGSPSLQALRTKTRCISSKASSRSSPV